jgi:hypothetical protein
MPGDRNLRVPFVVRLLENPSSRFALPGAVDLFGHDCVHLLLGRGLLAQDEAFVLGFTMGSSRLLRAWHVRLFRACARWLYRGVYRFSAIDGEVLELGVAAAREMGCRDLATVDYRSLQDSSLAELRELLGIRLAELRRAYSAERQRFPHTSASARLVTAAWRATPAEVRRERSLAQVGTECSAAPARQREISTPSLGTQLA